MERQKSEVYYFSRDKISRIYDFLPRVDRFRPKPPPKGPVDVAIVCDCGDFKRIGEGVDIRRLARRIINIDHHLDNSLFGDINIIELVSSASEIVYGVCKKMGVLTREIATCLYTGIMMDTGNFRYDNTTATTFRIASDLVRHGANSFQIAASIHERQSLPGMKILGEVISKTELFANGRVAVGMLLPSHFPGGKANGAELPQIVDYLRSINGVEVGILFRVLTHGRIKINFRAKHFFNVQSVAKFFGGGGHKKASACVVSGKLDDVKKQVLEKVCQQFQ
jgi:phosphoesterase RecJ-like protein